MAERSVAAGCCGSILDARITDESAAELANAFSALGNPVRLKLLSLLASADSGEVCVCDLVEPVGKTQGTVSHHLRILSDAGLVRGDRRGRWVWYSVVNDRLAELQDAMRSGSGRAVPAGFASSDRMCSAE